MFFDSCAAQRGRIRIALILVFVVTLFIGLIIAPGLMRARIASNETAAIGTLRTLSTSQAQFQSAGIVDADGDGVGEFGFLTELAGVSLTRGRLVDGLVTSRDPIQRTFITSTLGETAKRNQGLAEKSGYRFLVYLPTAEGVARAESGDDPEIRAGDADYQERFFAAYCWPDEMGDTGNRAFIVTQQGEVFSTRNKGEQEYSGTQVVPAPEAAFVRDLDPTSTGIRAPRIRGDVIEPPARELRTNAQGQLITGDENTGDGKVWIPAGC